jgi:NAD+ synthase (glutamine-hydrolysing)
MWNAEFMSMTVKVAIAQINCTVGDLAGNVARIRDAAQRAHQQGADIVVTPELGLTGYPPEDLLLRPAFIARAQQALDDLRAQLAPLAGLHVVVGHPEQAQEKCHNAASVLCEGRVVGVYRKFELPNYGVFDEQRYFAPVAQPLVFDVKGVRFGVNICEDTWFSRAPAAAAAAGAQVLLVPNASPFHMRKLEVRVETMREHVSSAGLSVVYANMVGGQDELVFDGASFVLDAQGGVAAQLPHFKEDLQVIGFDGARPLPGLITTPVSEEARVYAALTMGVADYLGKNGFPGAIIGLSGGIDSALVLAIAVDALGADKVRAVMMPSRYTADMSWIDARAMAENLGVRYDEIPISPMVDAFGQSLAGEFAGLPLDATEENIQARVRGTLLMALSNKFGSIVLTTGNKSELATGYCTLYGDMAGGFAVIKDVAKTLVYRLSRWRNTQSPVIPERIITRPPSAELRPDQTDQDSLPPYEVLDAIMQMYMEENISGAEIVKAGYDTADVQRVTRLIRINEYKRRQSPVGIRVTHRAFSRDWRYPITNRFNEVFE